MKLWLKRHSFETTEEIHAELQHTFENFQGCLKHAVIAVYMPMGTTLKETVETRSYINRPFSLSSSLKFG
jgi:hypothetical protein